MPVSDLDVLAPNYMGSLLDNTGLEEIAQNRGFGVREITMGNSQGVAQKSDDTAPGSSQSKAKNDLRVAKAREFGKPKTQVGF